MSRKPQTERDDEMSETSERVLLKSDIQRLGGLDHPTFIRLFVKNLVKVPGGGGQGNRREFNERHALAFRVVAHLRETWHGCPDDRAAHIIKAFQNVSSKWLDKQIKACGSFLVYVANGKPVLSQNDDVKSRFDVGEALQAIRERLAATDDLRKPLF